MCLWCEDDILHAIKVYGNGSLVHLNQIGLVIKGQGSDKSFATVQYKELKKLSSGVHSWYHIWPCETTRLHHVYMTSSIT